MKKLKENVHAIQVGCQICEGPNLDKECPLNEEVKQLEVVSYEELGRFIPCNGNNEANFRVGPLGYYTRTNNLPLYEDRRPSLEELMNKHQNLSRASSRLYFITKYFEVLLPEINTRNRSSSLKNLENQIEQLIKEIHSRITNIAPSSSTEHCKVVNTNQETPNISISSRKLNNIHRLSFLYDSDSQAGLSFLDFLLVRYRGQLNDSIRGQNDAEWYKENSPDNKPRPMDHTFKEWIIAKVGHTDVNEFVKKALLKSWDIDCFEEALDPDKDPIERSFDDYKWVFDLEIKQLADEYELGIGKKALDPDKDPMKRSFDDYKWVFDLEIKQLVYEYKLGIRNKGHILDMIWENCSSSHEATFETGSTRNCVVALLI
nr:hypothetical protein [Tanacetum cinerariifolium]